MFRGTIKGKSLILCRTESTAEEPLKPSFVYVFSNMENEAKGKKQKKNKTVESPVELQRPLVLNLAHLCLQRRHNTVIMTSQGERELFSDIWGESWVCPCNFL